MTAALRYTYAEILRNERELLCMSKAELSEKSGVDRRTIYEVENALTSPRLEVVEKLLNALGLELAVTEREPQP